MDKKNPRTIYGVLGTYICPNIDKESYEDDINEWNKYVKGKNTFLIDKIKRDNMKFYVKYVKDKNW